MRERLRRWVHGWTWHDVMLEALLALMLLLLFFAGVSFWVWAAAALISLGLYFLGYNEGLKTREDDLLHLLQGRNHDG